MTSNVAGKVAAALMTLLFAWWAAPAAADYPERPITLIVPYPPGASTDSLARVTATELGKVLGQTIVVENRPGGETTIATLAVKRARADGYTLMFHTGSLMTALYALKHPGYALQDFVPVSPLTKTPFVLTVPAGVPSANLDGFLTYARAHQASMNHGTLGGGASIYKVMGDALASAAGIKWTDIPYKGGMEGIQAVLSGEIQAYFATVSLAVSQRRQPGLKLLAVTDRQRSLYLPDIPTFAELGYPDVQGSSLYGLYVRAETPEPIQRTLEQAMKKVLASDAMKSSIASLSLEPYQGSLADYAKEVRETADKFSRDAARLGLERR
ncbi:MAG: tripartite tricarboxylate transporter substrate binding protein [Pigmentiphaga sp.]|uniref:tripartite tricarboxylate transporter substrate binding protein n=1 Tax=Pigmentiphaga sp. TaxID=1977564 RepID=UPI0029B36DF5|nr:tripartite tricarboxylate transporter substrate binding protein [Pigmentiphaga sp.]MDX3907030.1 tripartite tricarboxylate transporter substrate binding protein [Pigmentiphaga sp.]